MNKPVNDTVKEWLGAYLDGELSGDRRAWVEEHLAGCAECQQELTELRELAGLLQTAPVPQILLNEQEYAAQVTRRLPHPSQPFSRRLLRAGLRYAPLGLFGLWAFFQAALWLSAAVLFTQRLIPGAEGALSAIVPSAPSGEFGWLGGIFSLTNPAQPVIDLVGVNWLAPLILINLVAISVLALLFLAWLAGFYSYRRTHSSPRQFE